VAQEIERDGSIILPANGRRYEGAIGSYGCGQGRPILWKDAATESPQREFVLLVPQSTRVYENLMLIMDASAVVTDAGDVSHVMVVARGMKRPAVRVGELTLRDLTSYRHLIVDDSQGKIAAFFDPHPE
jgi:hypothetical protein